MTDKLPTLNAYDEACRRIASNYADDFSEFVAADERIHELIHDIAAEFVSQSIPCVEEESQHDIAVELLMNVTIRPV
jgi:hypothetical protein